MPVRRTFGWVQNPGDLRKLKKVVGIFLHDSTDNLWLRNDKLPLLKKLNLISEGDFNRFIAVLGSDAPEIEYSMLKGKGAGTGPRSAAICTGIIQAVITAQQTKTYVDDKGQEITIKKPYTDDWTAEGYLRWAICCGLVDYSRKADTCKITSLGEDLANAKDNSNEEREALTKALLAYPPVLRILTLLLAQDNQTKFELGSKLGFKNEKGFTSIPLGMFLCDYCEANTPQEIKFVKSNDEGDSDKYARGIASWCAQMGWISSTKEEVTGLYRGKYYTAILQTFSITRAGEKALKKAQGNSSNPRLPRIVKFEMLASNKTHGADYLRYQRAAIIKSMSSGWKTLEQLKTMLERYELQLDVSAIEDHIQGLISIGLDIEIADKKFRLKDTVTGLELPARELCVKDNINDIVDRVREKLSKLNHKYLILIDLAYSDAGNRSKKNADAREFEIQTADLFVNELGFTGKRLGDANRPDIIISYEANGSIIDNKSYKDGFNISKSCADEMSRYINENILRSCELNPVKWWENFDSKVTNFTFLFITSYLKGEFERQLEYISAANTGIKGAAIAVENLLYFGEGLKRGIFTYDDFFNNFKNNEMIFEL